MFSFAYGKNKFPDVRRSSGDGSCETVKQTKSNRMLLTFCDKVICDTKMFSFPLPYFDLSINSFT